MWRAGKDQGYIKSDESRECIHIACIYQHTCLYIQRFKRLLRVLRFFFTFSSTASLKATHTAASRVTLPPELPRWAQVVPLGLAPFRKPCQSSFLRNGDCICRVWGGEGWSRRVSDKYPDIYSGKTTSQRSGKGFILGRVRFIVNNFSRWQACE